MRISSKFIFVHIPKTGGTWMREALARVHINRFLTSSIMGRMLKVAMKVVPPIQEYLERRIISPLLFFEYSHSKLNELPADFLDTPPYRRRFHISVIIKLMIWLRLWKQSPILGLFLTHTRVSQLPASAFHTDKNILVPLANPLRWHISRYNYYRKRLPNNKHAADICNLIGEFTDFDLYCQKQMMQMQSIYYRSYITYLDERKNKKTDDFKYPTDVMQWYKRSSEAMQTPQHYGLLSLFFIWFLFPEPGKILCMSEKNYNDYIASEEFQKQTQRFNFLKTHNLNQETHEFLLKNDYQARDLKAINNISPINTSTVKDQHSLYYKSNKQLEQIHKLEKIIFYAVPDYI